MVPGFIWRVLIVQAALPASKVLRQARLNAQSAIALEPFYK